MYRHILIPVSFDDERNASASVSVARQLCDADTRVTLLHVMEQIPSYAINYIPEGFHEKAKAAISESLVTLAGDLPDAHAEVIDGHSARSILDWSERNGVDCIVIASHRPGLQDYFLGSTAAQVVRHARCSVHVLR